MKRLTEKRGDQCFVRANKGGATMICAPGADPAQRFEGEIVDRLAAIEDILGDEYDLDELKEVVQAKREGRCVVLPAGIGDTVYHITTCKNFSQVLDGTMYGPDGELGTATGLYCPCELAETCPFPCDYDGSFDCEKHKNALAIFEDVVTGILSDDMQDTLLLEYSGNAAFDDFGKTVFLTRQEAQAALRRKQE